MSNKQTKLPDTLINILKFHEYSIKDMNICMFICMYLRFVYIGMYNIRTCYKSQFASGRSSDRPIQSTFSVVFLGPRANAELVPKSHVALHASHAALPIVTSKFRPTVALPMLDQNVAIMRPFRRAKSFTLSQIYLYQKDERALPGNLQNREKRFLAPPPPSLSSLSLPLTFSLLSLSQ
jgi:hypothetical protein